MGHFVLKGPEQLCWTVLYRLAVSIPELRDKINRLHKQVNAGELGEPAARTTALKDIREYEQRLDATSSTHSTNMLECDATPPARVCNTTGVDDSAAVSSGVGRVETEEVVRGRVIGSKSTHFDAGPPTSSTLPTSTLADPHRLSGI